MSTATFRATNPATGEMLDPEFIEAGEAEVDVALRAAEAAFPAFARTAPHERAALLRAIADELLELGAALLNRANAETGIPVARLEMERTRTMSQLRLFADLLEEGSWVEARIDSADPARTPAPRPDIRRMLVPLGPVAVFCASNLPLAFSVAGNDTASALAAGCPVVCKAHPGHPGTAELMTRAVERALARCGMSPAVFTLLHGWSHAVGLALAKHPLTQAIGFTGSLKGGRAIFDAAAARPAPIPVYAEMGSINPVFLLPSVLAQRSEALAKGLAQSITVNVGQFCTNPGVLLGVRGDDLDALVRTVGERIAGADAAVMLYDGLRTSFLGGLDRARKNGAMLRAGGSNGMNKFTVAPALLSTDAAHFLAEPALHAELFGPASLVVGAADVSELERIAEALEGQLTASIHGTEQELAENWRLVEILVRKVGRVIFNGFPTGVEMGHAMQHGGPYPASTDSRTTSVGAAAITRFARPVCFQNFPDEALPPALRRRNALGIWRLVNGEMTRADG